MSEIKIGSPVRLKGGHTIMTVTQLREINCEVTWTIDEGKINTFSYLLDALEVVPDSEVLDYRKEINKRENAKVGLSIGDQISKIASPFVALLSVIVVAWQTIRLNDFEDKIDALVSALKDKTTQTIENVLPKRQE